MDSIGGYEMRRLKKRFITAIIAAVLAAGAAVPGYAAVRKEELRTPHYICLHQREVKC